MVFDSQDPYRPPWAAIEAPAGTRCALVDSGPCGAEQT